MGWPVTGILRVVLATVAIEARSYYERWRRRRIERRVRRREYERALELELRKRRGKTPE